MLLDLNEWRFIFISVCIVLIIAACAPVVMALIPSRMENFFVLAVLGETGIADHYYPRDDPRIEVGEKVNWTLYLHNHMGNSQYIILKIKLINFTISGPNSTSCIPSTAPVVYEIRKVLLNNETRLFPFEWQILDVKKVDDFLDIRSFSINGVTVNTHVLALYGYDYRFIVELWVYDEGQKDFQFIWGSEDDMCCAWNQVWFNVLLPD